MMTAQEAKEVLASVLKLESEFSNLSLEEKQAFDVVCSFAKAIVKSEEVQAKIAKRKEKEEEAKRFEYKKEDGYNKNSSLSIRVNNHDTNNYFLEQYCAKWGNRDLFCGTISEIKKYLEINKFTAFEVIGSFVYKIGTNDHFFAMKREQEKALTV